MTEHGQIEAAREHAALLRRMVGADRGEIEAEAEIAKRKLADEIQADRRARDADKIVRQQLRR